MTNLPVSLMTPVSAIAGLLLSGLACAQDPAASEPDFVFPEELSLVPEDVQRAAEEVEADEASIPLGMTPLEEALYRAQIAWIDEDWVLAQQYAETAASGGEITGAVMAGLIARDGRADGVPDLSRAASWFSRAAELEHPLALYEMGRLARQDVPGVDNPRSWFERAARAGHVPGMVAYALELRESPIPQERARAREWAERAAQQGFAEAMFQFGQLLDLGIGGEADLVSARSWYERAAQERHPEAALQAGIMWAEGIGGPRDDTRAWQFIREAAEMGYAPAQGQYGLLMLQGRGGERDAEMARFWFEQGAMGGDGESRFLLAVTLARQAVDAQDEDMLGQAYRWALLAHEDFIGHPVDEVRRSGLQAALETDLPPVLRERIRSEVDALR
ncbi:MAG: sel1 repeat family protein [Maricaulis sp.]|uniref:tetratricopeptide repeat protein n=1 Tax=Maricaulis sp. TaxID=1486257 RepID=UPI001B2515A8|nr:tetratricopeptide repeat protein [Maricaulis sp.]MBO6846754.1 sel1 repeat family protein [Maricaulis sp.]MBO6877885.1 sel1 repeat family protein [Maricaulis sp.]